MHRTLVIGLPGTGKTTYLTNVLSSLLSEEDFTSIGYVTFGRSARREAATKIANQTGQSLDVVEREGWVRTIHSAVNRIIGSSDGLITNSRADKQWVEEQIGMPLSSVPTDYTEYTDYDSEYDVAQPDDAAKILQLWDCARHTIRSLYEAWDEQRAYANLPSFALCEHVVRTYEKAKKSHGRYDFTDMLLYYIGCRYRSDGSFMEIVSDGYPSPDVAYWIVDEAQDLTPLLWLVVERLSENARAIWVGGDPWQAIYVWAGARPESMLARHYDSVVTLPQSYRCPRAVWNVAARIMANHSDYLGASVAPAPRDGVVRSAPLVSLCDEVNPNSDWLILSRTRWQLQRIAAILTNAAIPWARLDAGSTWSSTHVEATNCFLNLQNGRPIRGDQYPRLLVYIAQKTPYGPLLTRGTKAAVARGDVDIPYSVTLNNMPGATDLLRKYISEGRWQDWVPNARQCILAIRKFGFQCTANTRIRLATVHAAKGLEAENVAVLQTCTRAVAEASNRDEDRVKYVAVTRSANTLLALTDERAEYQWEVI